MKKLACFFVLLCMLLAVLTANAMAEGELKVFVHDALTMKYEVVGGSGQYEVVSTALCDYTGAVVSPSEFKDGSYYYATVIVRDLVTGETATGKQASLYRDPYYRSCERGEHYVETSESVGESPNYLVGTYYYDITETTHTILQKIAWHCDHCHAYVYTQELVNTREHYFDRSTGLCECGLQGAAACMHNQTAERKGSSWRIMVADNAEEHKLEQTYETYCVDCREVLSTSTETDWEDHTFNDKGYCVCGYYKAPECRHIRTAETFVGTSYTPSETDPGVHWAEPNYKVTCLDCGYVRNQTWEGMPEHHEFDENGRCVCGLHIAQACAHDHTEQTLVSTTYTPSETDPGIHWAVPNYQVTCLDCGTVRDETGIREPEHHTFGENEVCICGYRKDPEACTHENNCVPIETWEKERYEIREGDLTYHRTYHETWQSFSCLDCGLALGQKKISTTWDLGFHRFDAHQTCTQCQLHDETENRYQLEILGIQYRYGNAALIDPGDTVNIEVRDTVSGALYNYRTIAGMNVEFTTSSSKNKLTPYGYLTMQDGWAEVVLQHYGKEIGRAQIWAVSLEVEEWGINEGDVSGTDYVRLSDMLGVDWDASGMYLSEELMMFNFTAVQIGNGDQIIHFDVFNSCSSTYAVASYTADGKLYEKHFINTYSPDFWVGDVVVGGCQALAEGLDRKWGNSGLHTAKTCIEIVVPAGGYYTFLEAHEDEEVLFRNVAECLLTALGNSSDFVDLIVPGDADQVDELQKQLKKPENARKFLSTFWDAIKDEAEDELLDLFSDSSDALYRLLKNKSVHIALEEALKEAGVKVGIKSFAETVVELSHPGLALYTDIVDAALSNVYWAEHILHLEQNASGKSQMFFQSIVMPMH